MTTVPTSTPDALESLAIQEPGSGHALSTKSHDTPELAKFFHLHRLPRHHDRPRRELNRVHYAG